jgi:hypothetical protein
MDARARKCLSIFREFSRNVSDQGRHGGALSGPLPKSKTSKHTATNFYLLFAPRAGRLAFQNMIPIRCGRCPSAYSFVERHQN